MTIGKCGKGEAVLAGAELVAGSVGHIIGGLRLLTQQKILIPNCSACRAWHRWGMAAGFLLIGTAAAACLGFASMDQNARLSVPAWQAIGLIIGSLILGFAGVTVSSFFTWRATCVLIYRAQANLYYEFWSPRYQRLLISSIPKDEDLEDEVESI